MILLLVIIPLIFVISLIYLTITERSGRYFQYSSINEDLKCAPEINLTNFGGRCLYGKEENLVRDACEGVVMFMEKLEHNARNRKIKQDAVTIGMISTLKEMFPGENYVAYWTNSQAEVYVKIIEAGSIDEKYKKYFDQSPISHFKNGELVRVIFSE